jgi:phosphoketolase
VLSSEQVEAVRRAERARLRSAGEPEVGHWAAGYGAIAHAPDTQARVAELAALLADRGTAGDGAGTWATLAAADRLASAAMWLVVHQTYARTVHLDGRPLAADDFEATPEGHTGGSLNMVPAYVGYLAANALTGHTRSWIMGQGHTVSAIDSTNLLVGNLAEAHAERYSVTDEGLTRYVRDFYSYALGADGRQDSPLGSHVNPHTAGGMVEGGYLGFTELQYVHMPLPGERLVAFLSDGAFEEQRGSDWAPRWWRADDCGLVTPIMIYNGRRIDQRTTMDQEGPGHGWFVEHLRLNGFDPIVFDGRDPAAFCWAIVEMEERLAAAAEVVRSGDGAYPVRLPYGVAVAPKGAGFVNEGTNLAHNLPLLADPAEDADAAEAFNEAARRLWVPPDELAAAVATLTRHDRSGRPRERDHALATRQVSLREVPARDARPVADDRADPDAWPRSSPMRAVDATFLGLVRANPHLRPRVGNPDEMKSNRMTATLEALQFRVTDPEPGIPEDVHGAVITALNEEAVVSAALANKGGIGITVTYEAFGAKMHGAVRQEIIWAKHAATIGRPPGWLSIPLVLTSHTWENAKNEQSHQDPAMAEAMLGEASDVSRVVFPVDAASAAAALEACYATHGQLWTLVVPKAEVPELLTAEEAAALVADGALSPVWAGHRPGDAEVVLTAVGAYQLVEVLRASRRLAAHDVAHRVVALFEPGRFRSPRDGGEAAHAAPTALRDELWPDDVPARVVVSHTRPEPMLGVLGPLHTGSTTRALGFVNQGGTLNPEGLLWVNRCSWAHVVAAAAETTGRPADAWLTDDETAALAGRRSPEGVVVGAPGAEQVGTTPG